MKYLIVVYDGMADRPVAALGGRTPMEVAQKPMLDRLTKEAYVGTVSNVPEGMVPESDTANLAILSYDPKVYSKGRSPLEAVSMGLTMKPTDVAYRANVVTLSEEDGIPYEERTMLDHSADEISTPEADELICYLNERLGDGEKRFFTGVSYRHCLLWEDGDETVSFMRPHDILGQTIGDHLPDGNGLPFLQMMKESYELLKDHPVNVSRRARGLRPANSLWFWSPGRKPALPSFGEKWGLSGTVISAVDLIKGIGLCAGMHSVDVEGATGNIHTNFSGKAEAAIRAFKDGEDLVYIHVEAPDECGHRAEIENKVLSIEYIDQKILAPVWQYLKESGEAFSVLVLPDHPTPIEIRTHSMEPVPFMLWRSYVTFDGPATLTEKTAEATGRYYPDGTELMALLVGKKEM